jgi:hypothetical protein
MSSQPHLQAVKSDFESEDSAPSAAQPQAVPNSSAGGSTPSGSGNGNTTRVQKQRAERSLPTDRMTFDKQVEALRSIAQIGGNGRRSVTAEDISSNVGLKGGTGGLSNKFFRDSGWIVSAGRGAYTASDSLMGYHRHLNVDPADSLGARQYLAASARKSWYWEALEPMLEGGIRHTMVLHALSREAGATDHTHQLQMLLDWVEWLGLIRRDGDMVFPGATTPEEGNSDQSDAATGELPERPTTQDASACGTADPGSAGDAAPAAAPQSVAAVSGEPDVSALVSFSFNVRITADDAAKLSSEQLQSLLAFAEKLRG